jgi:ArsR family transcriptional regulator
MNSIEIALICKALSDSNRLQIVEMLANEKKCACKLLEKFDITQPTLSHHMKVLCECGLVESRKEGKWNHYTLNCKALADLKEFISALSCCNEGGNSQK